jgi:hypothetical protein
MTRVLLLGVMALLVFAVLVSRRAPAGAADDVSFPDDPRYSDPGPFLDQSYGW